MGYSNGIIEKPVSIRDLQQCFGLSSNDLGTLIQNASINMWARYKPQRFGVYRMMSHAERGAIQSDSREGYSKFGIKLPLCDIRAVMNEIVYNLVYEGDLEEGWVYLRPRGDRTPQGGIKEYYRLTDFVRNPNDAEDTTNAALKGYNRDAALPVTCEVTTAGVERIDVQGVPGEVLQINISDSNTLNISFYNSGGNDLHLQDFIDLDYQLPSGYAWRPVVQIWEDTPTGSTANKWYNKNTADLEISGDAITTTVGTIINLSIGLSTLISANKLKLNTLYHMCIGIGACNKPAQGNSLTWQNVFVSGVPSLFVFPFSEQQYDDNIYPFYCPFKLVEHAPSYISMTTLTYTRDGGINWITVNPTGSSVFEVSNVSNDLFRLTFEITKNQNKIIEFLGEKGELADQSHLPLKIDARMSINGGTETSHYLIPRTSTWQNPSSNPTVSAGTGTATLYAQVYFDLSNVPAGGYAQIHFLSYTGGSDWNPTGAMSIHKVR